MKAQVDPEILKMTWALIMTREWPATMFGDLAHVKEAITQAVKEVEVQSSDETELVGASS